MPAHRPHSPLGKPRDDTIHHCHPRWLGAPGRPRRGGNAAHSSVELLMITSSGKPFISLLSSQKK